MRRHDHFVDARHEGEDGSIRDDDDFDAELGEGFPTILWRVFFVAEILPCSPVDDGRMGDLMVIGVSFSMHNSEFAFLSGCCEEALHCLAGGVCENDFVTVNVIESGLSDLRVHNVEFFEEIVYARADFGSEVNLWFVVLFCGSLRWRCSAGAHRWRGHGGQT